MKIFDLLDIDPKKTKVHLAGYNGIDNPLDIWMNDERKFQKWQEHQKIKNFEREYIVSLIEMPGKSLWLFVGAYKSISVKESKDQKTYFYETKLTPISKELQGRLVIKYDRNGRNSFRNGEGLVDSTSLYEVRAEKLVFAEFENYKKVKLTRGNLEILFQHHHPAWKAALSSVKGVYLISDSESGNLYVGSAYGENGIWQRWEEYAKSYHGDNKEFKKLFKEKKGAAFNAFTYSILETFDVNASKNEVISSEEEWKRRLLSVEFGFNQKSSKK